MRLELPPLPAGTWLAVILERHEIVGRPMWAVTTRSRGGAAPVREWFNDADTAYTFALTHADGRALPFFDMTDGGAE